MAETMKNTKTEMLPEYDFSKGVRGKYVRRYQKGSNVVVLSPDLARVFRNFRHMVNIERKRRVNSVNVREGFPLIDLISPWEVGYEESRA
jgi:hypothetical protein